MGFVIIGIGDKAFLELAIIEFCHHFFAPEDDVEH